MEWTAVCCISEITNKRSFTLNRDKYLTVANYHDGSTRSIKSVIYKWNGVKFNKFQEIATEGAMGCTAFEINNVTYIAFANYYNSQQKYSVQSTVFKWSGGHFVKLQSLQTYGAYDVKSVNINGHTFLAFACYYSGSSYNTDSFVYKWDGTKFVLFQSIPTRGALAWHPFVISGHTYLGVANFQSGSQKKNIQSAVYQASGSQFVKYQEISTHGARDMTSFEYKKAFKSYSHASPSNLTGHFRFSHRIPNTAGTGYLMGP